MNYKALQKKYKISDSDMEQYRYQPEILRMLTMQGFYDRYCLMICRNETNEKAYESTERQLLSYFGIRRYKNYETFTSALSRWLKNKKNVSK